MRTMSSSLLEHGSLVTTEAKAKELRQFIEPLITAAKKEWTSSRRQHLARNFFTPVSVATLHTVADAARERRGGYLRLTKLPARFHDNVRRVKVDIIDWPRTQ